MAAETYELIKHVPGVSAVALRNSDSAVVIVRAEGDTITRLTNGVKDATFEQTMPSAASYVDAFAKSAGGVRLPSPPAVGRPRRFAGLGLVATFISVAIVGGIIEYSVGSNFALLKGPGIIPAIPSGKTVEEANAERGPVLRVEPTAAPTQPSVDIPTQLTVDKSSDGGVAIVEQKSLEQIVKDNQTGTSAPAAAEIVPGASSSEAAASAPVAVASDAATHFDDRTQAANASAEAAKKQASAEVAAAGPDKASEDVDKMKQVLALISAGTKISPDLAAQLPHDLAEQLKKAGAIQTADEANAVAAAQGRPTFAVIKIPPAILEQYRDADGILSIPDENSWAATGGNVLIPPPGGGDITQAGDFEKFSLQP